MTALQQLQKQIDQIETATNRAHGEVLSSGFECFDKLLPNHGYLRGTIVEWFSSGAGSGACTFSLNHARAAGRHGGALVIVDADHHIYPPALAAWGINLADVILLRGRQQNDLYWAVNQALRCKGVAAVWGWFTQINEQWFRRFQLSAESSGCMGFFVRPAQARYEPGWSQVRWFVKPKPTRQKHQDRQWQVELLRCRGMAAGGNIDFAIDKFTGKIREVNRDEKKIFVPLASQLAHPTARRRASTA